MSSSEGEGNSAEKRTKKRKTSSSKRSPLDDEEARLRKKLLAKTQAKRSVTLEEGGPEKKKEKKKHSPILPPDHSVPISPPPQPKREVRLEDDDDEDEGIMIRPPPVMSQGGHSHKHRKDHREKHHHHSHKKSHSRDRGDEERKIGSRHEGSREKEESKEKRVAEGWARWKQGLERPKERGASQRDIREPRDLGIDRRRDRDREDRERRVTGGPPGRDPKERERIESRRNDPVPRSRRPPPPPTSARSRSPARPLRRDEDKSRSVEKGAERGDKPERSAKSVEKKTEKSASKPESSRLVTVHGSKAERPRPKSEVTEVVEVGEEEEGEATPTQDEPAEAGEAKSEVSASGESSPGESSSSGTESGEVSEDEDAKKQESKKKYSKFESSPEAVSSDEEDAEDHNGHTSKAEDRASGDEGADERMEEVESDAEKSVEEMEAEEEEEDLEPVDPLAHLPIYFPGLSGCRTVDEFECLNRIEEGTYGVVYRATEKRTGPPELFGTRRGALGPECAKILVAMLGLSLWETIFVLMIVCGMLIFLWYFTMPKGIPPGPRGYPFIGCIPHLGPTNTISTLKDWTERYGNQFSFYMGSTLVIAIADYETLKEAFVHLPDNFCGRPQLLFSCAGDITGMEDGTANEEGVGLVLTNGDLWAEQRRFAMSVLKDLTVRKPIFEKRLIVELEVLAEEVDMLRGAAFSPHELLRQAVLNVFCSAMTGHRFQYREQVFQELLFRLKFGEPTKTYLAAPNFLPWLVKLPLFSTRFAYYMDRLSEMFCIATRMIGKKGSRDVHRRQKDISNYVDTFRRVQYTKMGKYFTERQLLFSVVDILSSSTEPVSQTVAWALVFMAKYPKIQQQVFAELDEKLSNEPIITSKHRVKLPFTEATLMEVQRLADIKPIGLPRRVVQGVRIGDYFYPQGAWIVPMIGNVLKDPSIFDDPGKFDPRRFMDEDGGLKHVEEWIPFSLGKRSCLGESVAKMAIFLFFATLMRKFQFSFLGDEDKKWKETPFVNEETGELEEEIENFKVLASQRF